MQGAWQKCRFFLIWWRGREYGLSGVSSRRTSRVGLVKGDLCASEVAHPLVPNRDLQHGPGTCEEAIARPAGRALRGVQALAGVGAAARDFIVSGQRGITEASTRR